MKSSSEAKQRSAAAKASALAEFKQRFPRANMSKFITQVEFDVKRKATARVLFPDGGGSWENALIEDSKYWSQPLKEALGVQQDGGFPYQLSPLQQNKPQPVPAIDFSDATGSSVADIFNKQMNIYVTPTDYFTTKFREIFKPPKTTITTSKYARTWMKGPNVGFWQQQLNFAVWCATTGCGVSREMLFPNTDLNLSEQVRTFYQFHVYYTTRKILFEMGGIQSKNALPDDPEFNEINNPYDVADVSVRSLVLPQVQTSATHGARTGVLAQFTFGLLAPRLLITTIQTRILLCSRMSELQTETIQTTKQTASISYEMIRVQTNSSSTLCQTIPAASPKPDWAGSTAPSRPSVIASWAPKPTREAVFWATSARRKPRKPTSLPLSRTP